MRVTTHWKEKSLVTFGIKIRPGIPSNWRIFKSNWLSMSSQFDSQCRVNLTLNVESIWLSMSSQFDSQCRVNLTLNVESVWLSMSSQFDTNILQLVGIPGRILVPPVTQLFRSKWLTFFFQFRYSMITVCCHGNSAITVPSKSHHRWSNSLL